MSTEHRGGRLTQIFNGTDISAGGSATASDYIQLVSFYPDHGVDGYWSGDGILRVYFRLYSREDANYGGPRDGIVIFEGNRDVIEMPRPLVIVPAFYIRFWADEIGGVSGISNLYLDLVETGGSPPGMEFYE